MVVSHMVGAECVVGLGWHRSFHMRVNASKLCDGAVGASRDLAGSIQWKTSHHGTTACSEGASLESLIRKPVLSDCA
eukprot:3266957-Amphidinium_carterae.1